MIARLYDEDQDDPRSADFVPLHERSLIEQARWKHRSKKRARRHTVVFDRGQDTEARANPMRPRFHNAE
jgi:hypothetical protein